MSRLREAAGIFSGSRKITPGGDRKEVKMAAGGWRIILPRGLPREVRKRIIQAAKEADLYVDTRDKREIGEMVDLLAFERAYNERLERLKKLAQ